MKKKIVLYLLVVSFIRHLSGVVVSFIRHSFVLVVSFIRQPQIARGCFGGTYLRTFRPCVNLIVNAPYCCTVYRSGVQGHAPDVPRSEVRV